MKHTIEAKLMLPDSDSEIWVYIDLEYEDSGYYKGASTVVDVRPESDYIVFAPSKIMKIMEMANKIAQDEAPPYEIVRNEREY